MYRRGAHGCARTEEETIVAIAVSGQHYTPAEAAACQDQSTCQGRGPSPACCQAAAEAAVAGSDHRASFSFPCPADRAYRWGATGLSNSQRDRLHMRIWANCAQSL